MRTHRNDSGVQRDAEALIRACLAERLNIDLAPSSLLLPGGSRVDVDGVSGDESVLVEIFAHQGKLKAGQKQKVARDALKLITIARSRRPTRLIIAFSDPDAAAFVRGRSWLSESLEAWGVEVFVIELEESARAVLREAQVRQIMLNPITDAQPGIDGHWTNSGPLIAVPPDPSCAANRRNNGTARGTP